MKKEEPSISSMRGNPSSLEENTGSLSRPGRTAAAQIEKPALSLILEFLMEAVVGESNTEPAFLMLLGLGTQALRRTAVWASRLTSLEVRMMFVFPVGHPFPLVVSQDLVLAQLNAQPLSEPDVRS